MCAAIRAVSNYLTPIEAVWHDPDMDFQTSEQVEALIEAAGGPSELARRMKFSPKSGRQRVGNWRSKGAIPPMVARAYAGLFRRILEKQAA